VVKSCPVDNSCISGNPIRVSVRYTLTLIIPAFIGRSQVPVTGYAEFLVP
jgi:hypothetical protein